MGPTATCAKTLFGHYLQRNDGILLAELDPPSTAQTPVLDASTGLPLANVVDAADGFQHGCAVVGTTKSALCWRTVATGNSYGQLGNGATDSTGPLYRATPVLTGPNTPLANVISISSVSSEHWGLGTCAITTEGKAYCWGNVRWIANDGSAALSSPFAIPITKDGVTPFTGIIQISLGTTLFESRNNQPFYACAVVKGTSSNEVWCWGANNYGNLGLGDANPRAFPTKVIGLVNPTKLTTGGENGTTCALDGMNVRCWGGNNQGQVGNGTTDLNSVLAPTIVTLMGGTSALDQIIDVRSGSDGSRDDVCALASDHTAKCWGFDFHNYPSNFGVTNIVALGSLDYETVHVLSSDGLYHIVPNGGTATVRTPNCGLLQ